MWGRGVTATGVFLSCRYNYVKYSEKDILFLNTEYTLSMTPDFLLHYVNNKTCMSTITVHKVTNFKLNKTFQKNYLFSYLSH